MSSPLAFAVACALRAAALLTVAWVITAVMRDQSAAKRHAVWLVAIVCALLVPFASATIPRVTIASVATRESSLARFVVAEPKSSTVPFSAKQMDVPSPALELGAVAQRRAPATGSGFPIAVLLTWFAGVAVVAIRSVSGIVGVRRLIARAQPISARRVSLFIDRLTGPKWSRRIRLVESTEATTPFSSCVGAHTIVLPVSHAAWSDRELQLVLAHETGHITRYDCVTHFAGTLLTAFHWFNPVAWRAVRALHAEAEQACDDRALRVAVEPVAYAELLFTFAQSSGRTSMVGALPMADSGAELAARLTAIVDATRQRDVCSARRHLLGAACGAVLVTAVAAPQLAATPRDATPTVRVPAAAPRENHVPTPSATRISAAPERTAADTGSDDERILLSDEVYRVARAATQARTGSDSVLAGALFDALDHVPLHDNDLVNERAAWALSRARGAALVAPLVDALSSTSWREVAYAAWALGPSRDGRTVTPLIGLLTHDAWRVRANAAAALNQLGDPRATDAMRATLGDGAWQVRAEAVEFLGRIGDIEPLRKMLKDPHIAVRLAAESALSTTGRSR